MGWGTGYSLISLTDVVHWPWVLNAGVLRQDVCRVFVLASRTWNSGRFSDFDSIHDILNLLLGWLKQAQVEVSIRQLIIT